MVDHAKFEKKEIVVLGAGIYTILELSLTLRLMVTYSQGVIGLTTAIVLQESGDYRVTIVADTFPGDEKSSRYTSCWAVCQHRRLR